MKFPKLFSLTAVLVAILPLIVLVDPAAAQGLKTALSTNAAAPAPPQLPTTVRLVYTSPAGVSRQDPLNVYLILFDLNNDAAARGSRVQTLRSSNVRAPSVFVMRPNQVVLVVVRSPNQPFSSFDPSAIGNLSVQVNGGAYMPVTLEEYDASTAAGYYNSATLSQAAHKG